MRPALNGLLDGLPFRGRLLMPTQAWILTLISLVTRRRRSPFPLTVLESQTPQLMPAPLPRLLLPLMTSDLLHVALLVFVCCFFLSAGFEPRIHVMSFSMNTPFLSPLLCLLSCQFELLGFWVVASSELCYLTPWLLDLP